MLKHCSFVRFPFLLWKAVDFSSHEKRGIMRLRQCTVMPILSCSSVLPVVGVRQGATGPGLRVRATPRLGSTSTP